MKPIQYGRCLFVDVGQGTANVILLRNKRAILLDAGPIRKGSPVVRILEDIDSIECVVLSHNDKDHIAGWEEVAIRFGRKIRDVWCLVDKNYACGARIDITMALWRDKKIPTPRRLSLDDLASPRTIWADTGSPLRLDVWYPDLPGDCEALRAGAPNRTSGIVCLHCDGRSILFPGDSEMDAWRRLAEESPVLPMQLSALAVPHHGGLTGAGEEDLDWLFGHLLKPQAAVISVGTVNGHRHPRPEVISALRRANVAVLCTQITSQCHDELESLRPGVIRPNDPGVSSPVESLTLSARRSRLVACAGTVRANLLENHIAIDRVTVHQKAVVRKLRSPLCRPK